MSEVKDDPKEVLSMLNSLGFVGITAPQLKSFMKDLKLYRKIKERERDAWKEEIKKKILARQRQALTEFVHEQEVLDNRKHNHPVKTNSPESLRKAEAMVKIKIKYSPKGKENDEKETFKQCRSKTQKSGASQGRECDFWMKDLLQNDPKYSNTTTKTSFRKDCLQSLKPESNEGSSEGQKKLRTEPSKQKIESPLRDKSEEKTEKSERRTPRLCENSQAKKRPTSAPEVNPNILHVRSKSIISDPGENASCSVTKFSVLSSQRKSFIRPWRLQPKSQKPWKKSDPVTLYQKYQEEWKQFPLPGENKHSDVRWAIRERMMGDDPHPRPAVYKSSSTSTLKKR